MLLNILSVATYWAINEVARDLEDPFILDPNDFPHQLYQVPAQALHTHFVSNLLLPFPSSHIPTASHGC
jgi:predicted membrane chloride channel (bestrophin family)